MENRTVVSNHGRAVDGIRNLLRHGIDTKCRMESVADGMESRTKGDGEIQAIRLMPYADEPQFHTIRNAN